MDFDFFEVIKRAWQITWKYKFLWVFGYLIALAAGGSNYSNSLNSYYSSSDTTGAANGVAGFAEAYLAAIIIVVAVLMISGLVFWILSILSTGGLVGAAAKIERGEATSLKDGFKIGAKNFWRVFGLNLIVGLIIFLMIMAVIVPLIVIIVVISQAGDQGGGMLAGMICLILVGIVAIFVIAIAATVLSLISIYATRYIVLESGRVFASFKNGWRLIRRKLGPTFLMFLLVMLISSLAGLAFAVPGLIIGVPVLVTMFAGIAANNFFVVFLSFIGFLFLAVVMSFFNGVLETYRSTVWTLTFMRISGGEDDGEAAKLPVSPPRSPVPMIIEKPDSIGAKPASKPVTKKTPTGPEKPKT